MVNSNVQRDLVLMPSIALNDIALSQLDTMLFVTGNWSKSFGALLI